MPLTSALSILGREALRIVLPSWCIVCARELPWRDRSGSCCGPCWRSLPRLIATCRSCARALPVSPGRSILCLPCQLDPLPVDWSCAWGEYTGGLERVLHAFKFERHDFLDAPLATLLEEALRANGDLSFDALVPVPMHAKKQRSRGYNQAELLARGLARRTGIRCDTSLLKKIEEGSAQSTLPRAARAANVRGAYAASDAGDRSLLVIDDISTTGETVRSCANALLRAGAARVCALTVAKAS